MSGSEIEDIIQIRAQSKQNSLTALLAGALGLSVSVAILSWLPESMFLVGVFALSASLVTLLIAWCKWREPPHSLQLTRQQIAYLHRNGQWCLDWDNIQRIDVPKIYNGLEHKSLGLVGLKIKDYMPLIDNISPRLATNILLEQRPLLLQLQKQSCTTGGCYSEDMLEDELYKDANGRQVKGVKGMLGNRMKKLRARLGYDLYISASELDRSEQDFVILLRECHQQVLLQKARD